MTMQRPKACTKERKTDSCRSDMYKIIKADRVHTQPPAHACMHAKSAKVNAVKGELHIAGPPVAHDIVGKVGVKAHPW